MMPRPTEMISFGRTIGILIKFNYSERASAPRICPGRVERHVQSVALNYFPLQRGPDAIANTAGPAIEIWWDANSAERYINGNVASVMCEDGWEYHFSFNPLS